GELRLAEKEMRRQLRGDRRIGHVERTIDRRVHLYPRSAELQSRQRTLELCGDLGWHRLRHRVPLNASQGENALHDDLEGDVNGECTGDRERRELTESVAHEH